MQSPKVVIRRNGMRDPHCARVCSEFEDRWRSLSGVAAGEDDLDRIRDRPCPRADKRRQSLARVGDEQLALGQEMADRAVVGRVVRRFERVLLRRSTDARIVAQPRQLMQARTTQRNGHMERDERDRQELSDTTTNQRNALWPTAKARDEIEIDGSN